MATVCEAKTRCDFPKSKGSYKLFAEFQFFSKLPRLLAITSADDYCCFSKLLLFTDVYFLEGSNYHFISRYSPHPLNIL